MALTGSDFPFDGKTVMVTGGAAGIGKATAEALAELGANIVIVDIAKAEAEEVAHGLSRAGHRAIAISGDVADENTSERAVEAAVQTFGGLACAFNNAGIANRPALCAEIPPPEWDHVMRVNVRGVWACMRAELGQMLKQGQGVILNTASIGGLRGFEQLSAYVAAKHAVVGMTRSAAREYAARGVRINAICPGSVHTAMTDKSLAAYAPEQCAEMLAKRVAYQPIGRLGTTEEIADAACYLLGDASRFIIGQAISVDGGWNS